MTLDFAIGFGAGCAFAALMLAVWFTERRERRRLRCVTRGRRHSRRGLKRTVFSQPASWRPVASIQLRYDTRTGENFERRLHE